MAQKSNPVSLRLKKTNKLWNSCWYGDYNYTQQLLQDRGVEAHIQNVCQQAKMAPPVVFLNRQRQQTSTFFFFSRQQRTNRLRFQRNTRGPFQRSPLPRKGRGADWLYNLFFWSRKVPIPTPRTADTTPPLTVHAFNKIAAKRSVAGSASPQGTMPGVELFRLLPYLFLSQKLVSPYALPQGGHPAWESTLFKGLITEKETQQAPNVSHLSSSRPGVGSKFAPAGEEKMQSLAEPLREGVCKNGGDPRGNSPDTLYPTVKDTSQSSPLLRCAGLLQQAGITGGLPLQKNCQQEWGFFAMRNQYLTAQKKRVQPSGFGGLHLQRQFFPNQVQSGGSINIARNVASPWRNHLESCISAQTHHNSTLHFLLCPSIHQNPHFLATQLCFSLENRKTFRRLKDRLMQDISADNSIKGVRITCSGRVAARSKKAQKARTESIQWGQTSLNVFSDLVNFASKSALTPFGKIGVKVWICYKQIKKKSIE